MEKQMTQREVAMVQEACTEALTDILDDWKRFIPDSKLGYSSAEADGLTCDYQGDTLTGLQIALMGRGVK